MTGRQRLLSLLGGILDGAVFQKPRVTRGVCDERG